MKQPFIALIAAFLAAFLLAGCAEVTFKRGAGPDAMESSERSCRDKTDGEEAYRNCMRDSGWVIIETADLVGGEAVEPTAAAAGPAPTASPQPVPVAAPVPDPSPASAAGVAAPATTPAAVPPPPAIAPPPTAVPAVRAATATPVPAATAGPSSRIQVSSWWKFGGSAADLDRAIDACATELGEAHRPEAGARVVTGAMKSCLRKAGWRALGEKAVP